MRYGERYSRGAPTPASLPRMSYLEEVAGPSRASPAPVAPKSRLLVSDLDNTLFGPSGDGIVARPYLRTFIRYIMHPDSPYAFAIWTFSGRRWGQAHLRQAGVGDLLFQGEDRVIDQPTLKEPLKVLWGYEDSGFLPSPPHAYGSMASGPAVKDLELIWELLNIQGHDSEDWSPFNSLIVDDQISNGAAEPDSIVVCPVFTQNSPDDDFLLAFIGVLDELAPESNFAAKIKQCKFSKGIPFDQHERYVARGITVCREYGIKATRGTPYHDPAFVEEAQVGSVKPPSQIVHDAALEPAEPHPASFFYGRPVPKRVAMGMPLSPSDDYSRQVAQTSRRGSVGKPLIVFDLDGTLYHRPPQNLEHDPAGEPVGRPYLRSFLEWILRPESPWTVAIWTGSQKKTAVRCLYELDLGIVGPDLVANDQAEVLHPKIKAVWAREDFNLTPEDYRSYVAVVKDLSRLWKALVSLGLLLALALASPDLSKWGTFDATNTVMVDDTPSKLRAQPANLIAAPTFDYPEEPGTDTTSRAQNDTFLVELVSMLTDLAPETNFANAIAARAWNCQVAAAAAGRRRSEPRAATDELDADHERRGTRLLQAAGIAVDAQGRGLLPGTLASRNDPGYRTRKRSLLSKPLARVPRGGANPYHSDTSGGASESSSTSESVAGDDEVPLASAVANALGRLPRRHRHHHQQQQQQQRLDRRRRW
ncbi:hypothetical protein JCM11491_004447 [Sporobolomyces phaffii]